MAIYLGIDLTASERRPSAHAALDEKGEFVSMGKAHSTADLLSTARTLNAKLVGIDSPLGLPLGYCCLEESCPCSSFGGTLGRSSERALAKIGIPLFWTNKRSIIKAMVYRGIGLARTLSSEGRQALEVYPYGTRVRLWGRRMPKKTTHEGRNFLANKLSALIPGVWEVSEGLDHDLCDALLAAYTVYLFTQGLSEFFGSANEQQILLPIAGLALKAKL